MLLSVEDLVQILIHEGSLLLLLQVLLHPFYSSIDFVQDYPGELVPQPIWILL